MQSITRVADVSLNTVTKLLIDASKACAAYHDRHVRNVVATRIQCMRFGLSATPRRKNVADAKAVPEGAGDIWT